MSAFKTIVVADRQTVTDLALQEYGCVAPALVLLLKDNEGVITSVHTVPAAGTILRIRVPVPELTSTNRQVAAAYAAENRTVVSNNEALPNQPITDLYVEDDYVQVGYINNAQGVKHAIQSIWHTYINTTGNGTINSVKQNFNPNYD